LEIPQEEEKMTKEEIREYVAGQKSSMGLPILETHSLSAVKRLKRQPEYLNAKTVGAYAPLPDEVDITPAMTSSDRMYYIPAFDEELGGYRLARMGKTFKRGRFGILEPVDPVFAEKDEIDLIIVPGIAFDGNGHRIGRGGGFYDQLLPLYDATRAAICFDFQCLEKIPTEPHDCTMNLLITESKTLKF
jgi:5-formyltetrahydrofolate cyclo-ligase